MPRLIESIKRQTFRDFELCLVKGVSPQGKAINRGAEQTHGEILLILDDDSSLADEWVFQRLVDTLDADASIGMAGASIVVAPDASPFQRRAAEQFPRFNTPVVDRVTNSDFACHGCCAIPRRVFDLAGREREDLLRGLDPDLRLRIRAAGFRVVLAPNACIHHPLPDGWRGLLRTFFRNGYGSAYACKFQPESVCETGETLEDSAFQPKTSLPYRMARFPIRLARALVHRQWLRFGAYCAYACGYAWGMAAARENAVGGGS